MNVSEVGVQKPHYGHQQPLILHTCWVNLEKPAKNKQTEMEGDLGLKGNLLFIIYLIFNLKHSMNTQ